MPFLGKDWRSPGESWVRTGSGWEQSKCWRQKFLENLNENIIASVSHQSNISPTTADQNGNNNVNANSKASAGSVQNSSAQSHRVLRFPDPHCSKDDIPVIDNHHPTRGLQPHINIPKGITRERVAKASISEAFNKLDMQSAVKDLRRFRYTCRIIQLLINKKFGHLSGTSQKQIITVLEEAVKIVLKTEVDVRFVQSIVSDYHTALNSHSLCIGSSSLHKKHLQITHDLKEKLENFKPRERKDDGEVMLLHLPDEMIREILRRLTDHVDLLHTGSTQSDLYALVQEDLMWKELCFFHFSRVQLCAGLSKDECLDDCNWKYMYRKLVKRHGKKEVFAVQIHMCSNCNALFWKSHGHPCPCTDPEILPHSRPVSTDAFINIFFH